MLISHHVLVLLLHSFLFFAWTCQTIGAQQQIPTPAYYLGDTPYKNQPFNSANITTALLIQRDLAMNVTIDQIIWPALDLSTAFFGNDFSFQQLQQVAQPLLMGYKRLVVDLYWDPTRSNWQLCPVAINSSTADDVIVGRYTCAPRYLFKDFMASINDYLVSTEIGRASVLTNLVTLILNIHDLPSTTSSSSSSSNKVDSNLGQIVLSSLSKTTYELAPRIYTPANLTTDRINISASFYAHGQESYFPIQQQSAATTTTTTMWPQWLYLIQNKVQLLVGFGTVQQSNSSTFNITSFDQSVIFNSSSLTSVTSTTISLNTSCSAVDNSTSWSFVNDNSTIFSYNQAFHVTECGYSPYFTHSNYSDSSSTYSNIDSGHLADNILSTIWSWDINEPNTAATNIANRCAAIQQTSGRWIAYDCAQPLRIACRLATNPNQWIITNATYIYDRALTAACPNGYVFDVPRVPKQNIKLRQAIVDANVTDKLVWLNLNLMNTKENCWVIGQYGTCWWSQDSSDQFIGLITTSIVSGVIILILVGIFVWVKCARWWRNRNSGPRKNMVKAMLARREYVTVPA